MKRRYRTLILSKDIVEGLVDIKESMKVIESAFRSMDKRRSQMPPKIYIHLDKYSGDFRAMPAFLEDQDRCALKWVNVHPDNKSRGLPSVMAVIILSDPQNGFPLCIMDGTCATNLRTGAAGGVAAKYLARKDSGVIGMVGCGAQAETQLLALKELFAITGVKAWGHKESVSKRFVKNMRPSGLNIKIAKDLRSCVEGCDIIITTTPSRKPLVKRKWLKMGVHINAIGADARGKEELEPKILKDAKIVVDSWEQASHSGEINVPLKKGLISKSDICADIGQIVTRKRRGRRNKAEITVFDSTGLAIQDVAISNLIYKTALRRGRGTYINLVT
jgi:alanine dehydrogenase